jgi:hypothetical protein
MKFYFHAPIIAVLIALLIVPTTGCSPSQQSINTAVADIGNVMGIINTSLTALQADIALFPASDQAVIAPYVSKGITDSAAVMSLCSTYLAAPSASVLSQISATFSTLASDGASATLAILQIKNPNSQQIARGIIAAVATSLAIASVYLSATGASASPSTTTSIQQMKAYVDRAQMENALQLAKNQGLAPQNYTLAQAGF